ncbi:hypothetical protein NKI25_29580 [Mesorhizobium sp. M0808]|uniref:hypothetical protein n=1 Tax=Mesorhizobium sp. M0808 TaxID=2957002 RepID=UPI0033361954
MTDKSAAELERDADIARARVADTADSIRSKMTPGQLIDEFTGMFSGEGSAMLSNLKTQVRDNPLPLTLVGAGLAWLMLGKGTSVDSSAPGAYSTGREPDGSRNVSDERSLGGAWQDSRGDEYGAEGEASAGSMLSDAARSAASVAGGATEAVADVASGATERLRSTAGQVGSAATDMTGRVRQSAQDLFQREPLAMAAVGLAVGTAIGVMLPHTAAEDAQLGPYRDKLRDSAEEVFEEGVEQAKQVAAEAYETVKEEADRQGSSGDAETLVDRVEKVVKKTASKTEEAIRDRLPETDEAPKSNESPETT